MPEFADTARYIAYVRPHADRIASSFGERIKQGLCSGTMEKMHKQSSASSRFIYAPRFLKWREALGDAFELRIMSREQLYRKDVVADFLQFALQTEDFSLSATPGSNETLSLENLAVVRQLQVRLRAGQEKFRNYQTTIGLALARRMNDSAYRDGTKVRLHRALAELVRDQYAEDAAALDAAFFKGTPMSDALNAAPAKADETAQSVRIEDHFSDREQYLINTFIDQTVVLIGANPALLAKQLRLAHRGNVIAQDDHDGTAPPTRRRAGKGGKGGKGGKAARRQGAGKPGAGKAGAGKVGAGKARRVRPAAASQD